MTAMFEQHPKVLYRKNVLEEVICQLRFPEILRIDAELPSAFQERIRTEFPLYVPTEAPKLPPELQQFVKIALPNQARRFESADQAWAVSLAGGFIALTTKAYTRWSDFQTRLEGPLKALSDEYRPAFFTRLGLRYRNVLRRSALGVTLDWNELLKPHVAAELSSVESRPPVATSNHQVVFQVSPDLKARLLHGLVDRDGESCYVLDADFFVENVQVTAHGPAIDTLRDFNRHAIALFRWCISDRLHEVLEPEPIPD